MQQRLQNVALPGSDSQEIPRECHMSADLYQNACQTMGELRDILRASGMSWEFIQHQIDLANHRVSAIDDVFLSFDEYSTGLGKNLRDLPSNVW